VLPSEIEERASLFSRTFDIQPDCPAQEVQRSARTSVALDKLVEKHDLGSLAYYYRGTGNSANEDAIGSIIVGSTYLTANGVPVAGEYEVKNVQAMKIMDAFHAGGSFSEFYATDYKDDVVLLGHDGPGHSAIAEGKVKVKPLSVYHGKVGRGLSVEMSVKHRPVTLLSVVETAGGGMKLLVAEGESVPGPILEIGNTNSRYRFSIGVRKFVTDWSAAGPAHHCAIGIGRIASKLEKLSALLDLEIGRVC
jgi:L-arabinose isomerase